MKWVQGYLNKVNHGKWELSSDFHLQKYGEKVVFLSNFKPQDVPQLNLRDPYLREILEHWTTLNYTDKNHDFNSMGIYIWHNSLIRIENRPFFYTSCLKEGVKEVMYQSNRSFNIPPPGQPPGICIFCSNSPLPRPKGCSNAPS